MDAIIYFLAIIDKVHLIDTDHEMRYLQQARDDGMPSRLFEYTLPRINQDQRYIGRAGTCDHVARILDVSRCIRDDKLPLWCREISVCNINGDPLFAFCFQSIGQ